jgi:hypothetical protein
MTGKLPRRFFHRRGGRRAQPPVGEGSAAQATSAQSRHLRFLFDLFPCVIQSEGEESRIFSGAWFA